MIKKKGHYKYNTCPSKKKKKKVSICRSTNIRLSQPCFSPCEEGFIIF